MTSDAERKLIEYGWPLEEVDFGREDEPDIGGYALVKCEGNGVEARLIIRPGLADDRRASLAEWMLQLVERFIEHGPDVDGWYRRSDEGWQLWFREHDLPSF